MKKRISDSAKGLIDELVYGPDESHGEARADVEREVELLEAVAEAARAVHFQQMDTMDCACSGCWLGKALAALDAHRTGV